MKRLFVALAAILLLALAGCSGESAASGPSTPTAPPSPAASPDASSPNPATSASAVSKCLSGRYRLVRFVGVGEKGTYGTGQGGDVTVTFDNGTYLLRGAGKNPIRLRLAGQNAGLLVNGTVAGDYQLQGDRASFTVGESTGSATLQVGPVKKSLPISEVANVLAPDGEAGLSCANDALIVTLQDVRLELGKV
ncbi:MAG TPA: hypothetical protein VI030_12025 [Propionibacteriaceae bacterium]